jgi:hypothetical protein
MPFDPLISERARLRADLLFLAFEVKLIRLALLLARKADDDEDEGPEDDDGPNSPHLLHLAGAGDPPPQLPDGRPPTSALRTQALKFAARELAQAIQDGRAEEFLNQLQESAKWIGNRIAEIKSYLDAPRSLAELNDLANEPAPGYQIHHIVEQTPALQDGYSRSEIDSPNNLVRVPTLKHYEINAWYQTPNERFGGETPRQYLRDKAWYVRRDVGLDALEEFGVLE